MNNKEVVKRIDRIFESIKCGCYIDSLIKIDENIYDCDGCILTDTVRIRREDMLGKVCIRYVL